MMTDSGPELGDRREGGFCCADRFDFKLRVKPELFDKRAAQFDIIVDDKDSPSLHHAITIPWAASGRQRPRVPSRVMALSPR